MVKTAALLIIVCSCSKIGFDVSAKYKRRCAELRSLMTAFELMKSEINFTKNVVAEVILNSASVSSYSIKDMLESVAFAVKNGGVTAGEAFKEYISRNLWRFALKKGDLEIIDAFFAKFGTYSADDQTAYIESALNVLKNKLDEAVSEERKYSRLFASGGVAFGFLLAVIFI